MDVIEHLMEEHRKAEQLIEQLSASEPGPDRSALIDQLEEALSIHMAVEEEFLYPIVEDAIGSEEADEANAEHGLARQGLVVLRQKANEPGFGAAVDMLKGGIEHHVEEEENELFPQLRQAAGEKLAQLDPEKLEKVAGASREELYKAARERGVEGRSNMTKAELADAVTAAESRSE